jgi:hypothetical protein
VRIFPIDAKDDGLYITIRLDENEYEQLARGRQATGFDMEQSTNTGSSPPGEVAVFLDALGKYIASYAATMSGS